MKTLEEMEKDVILARLNELNGNRTHTARSLKIGIRTLQRKLKIYGVAPASRYLPVKCRDTGRVFASRAEAGLELFQNLCSEQRTAKVKQLVEYGQLEVL